MVLLTCIFRKAIPTKICPPFLLGTYITIFWKTEKYLRCNSWWLPQAGPMRATWFPSSLFVGVGDDSAFLLTEIPSFHRNIEVKWWKIHSVALEKYNWSYLRNSAWGWERHDSHGSWRVCFWVLEMTQRLFSVREPSAKINIHNIRQLAKINNNDNIQDICRWQLLLGCCCQNDDAEAKALIWLSF